MVILKTKIKERTYKGKKKKRETGDIDTTKNKKTKGKKIQKYCCKNCRRSISWAKKKIIRKIGFKILKKPRKTKSYST